MSTVPWAVVETTDQRFVHVLPAADSTSPEHILSVNCWCHPELKHEARTLVVHFDDSEADDGA